MSEEVHFTGVSRITGEPSGKGLTIKYCDYFLEISGNLDASRYLNTDGLPHGDGYKAFTQALVQGISANIAKAHEDGVWLEADHLRYVITELERAFVHPSRKITKDIFNRPRQAEPDDDLQK